MSTTPAVEWEALDYSDPAALLAKLRPAYYRLIAGEADAEIEGTDRRRVKFAAGNIAALERVMRDLEGKVATAAGKRLRFAAIGRFGG